jgi:hypothetical protein
VTCNEFQQLIFVVSVRLFFFCEIIQLHASEWIIGEVGRFFSFNCKGGLSYGFTAVLGTVMLETQEMLELLGLLENRNHQDFTDILL